jgi:hypothetical protein
MFELGPTRISVILAEVYSVQAQTLGLLLL